MTLFVIQIFIELLELRLPYSCSYLLLRSCASKGKSRAFILMLLDKQGDI